MKSDIVGHLTVAYLTKGHAFAFNANKASKQHLGPRDVVIGGLWSEWQILAIQMEFRGKHGILMTRLPEEKVIPRG